MTKKIFAIIIAVVISFTFVVSASADTYMHVADNANKLSSSEHEELENIAIKLENTYGICVMICIADETTGMYDDAYAEWIYTGNTDNENGILLLHNDGENTYAVFTSGNVDEIFDDEAIAEMRDAYDKRRRFVLSSLSEIGLSCFEPKGAFYAFPCIKSTGLTSEEFCERLLREKHVAVVPGTAFGDSGEGFVRASYCYSTAHIKEALRRIGEFLKTL